MTDDLEEGPDPNDIRRHAKRMYTEAQYRQKYRRIDFYRPNRKQFEFHNVAARERMLRAGNQEGKTHAVGAQMAMDALSYYPDWYSGRRFIDPPKIERPFDFLGWAACDTSVTTRNGAQSKLLGDIMQEGGLGTGLIPLDNIVGKPAMARGISDFVDSVTLRREVGGSAVIRFKTYEQGQKAFQGEPCDEIWLDEDIKGEPEVGGIYAECLARLTTTNGQIVVSMTPVLGATPIRRRYKSQHPGTREILMTLDDALVSKGGHIPDERVPELIAQYRTESERQTKLYGADMQGEGAVFEFSIEQISHTADWSTFPSYWAWLWAVDFSGSGSGELSHPFAAVLGAWNRDADVIYVVEAVKMRGLAPVHVAAMREHPLRLAPVAWPHDGGKGAGIISGETVKAIYQKLGLNMRPTHAQFADGGYNFEAGVKLMEERFAASKLKIARHLSPWFDEYQGYHRKDGFVVKVDDDLLSATRQLCMDIRFAKPMENFRAPVRPGMMIPTAPGTDFDLFTGAAV